MIIKDKPFHVPCCQAVWCWYYASPVFVGPAIPSSFGCHVDLVRRWPSFHELEAYQLRLSRYLVRSWSIRKVVLSPLFPAWDDPRSEGGIW